MLGTLKLINQKINFDNFSEIWNRLVESQTPSVTFAFLQMDESNGLDDDIYIKMKVMTKDIFEELKEDIYTIINEEEPFIKGCGEIRKIFCK